ncbi:hypothetical protein HZS_2962, partial [Henneguya salminicola]
TNNPELSLFKEELSNRKTINEKITKEHLNFGTHSEFLNNIQRNTQTKYSVMKNISEKQIPNILTSEKNNSNTTEEITYQNKKSTLQFSNDISSNSLHGENSEFSSKCDLNYDNHIFKISLNNKELSKKSGIKEITFRYSDYRKKELCLIDCPLQYHDKNELITIETINNEVEYYLINKYARPDSILRVLVMSEKDERGWIKCSDIYSFNKIKGMNVSFSTFQMMINNV